MTYRRFLNRGMDCLLAPLADNHVYIVDTDGEAHTYGLTGYTTNYQTSVSAAYLDGGGVTFGASGHVTAGTITGTDVLYVRVDSRMGPSWSARVGTSHVPTASRRWRGRASRPTSPLNSPAAAAWTT